MSDFKGIPIVDSRPAGVRPAPFDALSDRAGDSANLAQRAALMSQAESLAMREQPLAPLYIYVSRRLIATRVQGWVDNPRGVHLNRYLWLQR